MNINYESVYKEFANQTIDWVSGDTKETYENNLRERRSLLEKHNWLNNKVTYTLNSEGFRCKEFTNDPSVMFLGCSFTLGVGVNVEQSWTTIVSDSLNLKCINLGQAGGSNDTAFRLGSHWIKKLQPKLVILLTPSQHRLELIEKKMIHFFTPGILHKDRFSTFLQTWLHDETNAAMNVSKNTLALEYICLQNKIKFVKYDASNFRRLDYARDLAHPGVESHKELASKILNLVEAGGIEPL
jgi:hypothetical protein